MGGCGGEQPMNVFHVDWSRPFRVHPLPGHPARFGRTAGQACQWLNKGHARNKRDEVEEGGRGL
jgi:hypothetical protein